MKKKILALCLVVALAATAVIGGTLAYFTDTDKATNTFTTGNVDIAIREVVDEDTHLLPGKKINKDVFVQNTGSEEAYVRVHIAIPFDMDDGDPQFNASKNFLHWNFTGAGTAEGQWNWSKTADGANYPGNGGAWNYYTTEINGAKYAVYVATYESKVADGAVTATESLTQVYMDATVDAEKNEDGTITYKDTKGNTVTLKADEEIKIEVFAEGGQVEGFANAYDALNTQFGTPGTYNPWKK